jgi:2-polyprenyl-3-methyl-5-hydroxy-6-metoxy-1,4-benzoquinol methylase
MSKSSTDEANAKGYGWTSDITGSTEYLAEPVISALRRRQPGRVLDLGCGNAWLTRRIHQAGIDVVGVDADQKGIDIARGSCPGGTFFCRKMDEGPPAELVVGFSAVVSTEVIELLYRPEDLLTFASAALRDGGFLILITPYNGYAKNLAIVRLNKWDLQRDPLWTGGHIKFWSRAFLQSLLEKSGVREVEFIGAGRLPYHGRT